MHVDCLEKIQLEETSLSHIPPPNLFLSKQLDICYHANVFVFCQDKGMFFVNSCFLVACNFVVGAVISVSCPSYR